MLKSIKGNAKLFVETFKAAFKAGQMIIIPFEGHGEIKGIPYNECNIAVRATGSMFGMATRDGIVTDYLFNELSDNAKEFIIRHEKAHIELGHIDVAENMIKEKGLKGRNEVMKERNRANRKGEVHYMELEADKQAAEEMGIDEAIHALLEMNLLVSNKYGVTNKELVRRVNALMSIH